MKREQKHSMKNQKHKKHSKKRKRQLPPPKQVLEVVFLAERGKKGKNIGDEKNMEIKDLVANETFDEIVIKIIEKNEPREIVRPIGRSSMVCDLIGEDDTGNTVKITLWNDEIDVVQINDTIRLIDGWVKEWEGQLQVSTGRQGKIIKL